MLIDGGRHFARRRQALRELGWSRLPARELDAVAVAQQPGGALRDVARQVPATQLTLDLAGGRSRGRGSRGRGRSSAAAPETVRCGCARAAPDRLARSPPAGPGARRAARAPGSARRARRPTSGGAARGESPPGRGKARARRRGSTRSDLPRAAPGPAVAASAAVPPLPAAAPSAPAARGRSE